MGVYSWKTQDTGRSISNIFSWKGTFPVTMLDDKGTRYYEENYGGYGEFNGKNFYVLLAEMNGFTGDKESPEYNDRARSFGIGLAYGKVPYLSPNLVEKPDEWEYIPDAPPECEHQGFFYPIREV